VFRDNGVIKEIEDPPGYRVYRVYRDYPELRVELLDLQGSLDLQGTMELQGSRVQRDQQVEQEQQDLEF
jgi:hypothetical protein